MSASEDEQPATPAAPTENAHTAPAPVGVARFWPVVSGAAALALVVMLALVIFYRETDKPFGFEIEFMAGLVASRADWLTVPALVLNAVGGGILSNLVVPAVIIGALLLFRRPWGAVYYVTAAIASAAVTRLIKVLVGRERPEDILVTPDFGSFPSGHSSNAALVATALGIIFMRTWVWVAGAVVHGAHDAQPHLPRRALDLRHDRRAARRRGRRGDHLGALRGEAVPRTPDAASADLGAGARAVGGRLGTLTARRSPADRPDRR